MKRKVLACLGLLCVALPVGGAYAQSFINWETPHVHPMDITPDGLTVLAVNIADNRLEVFDNSGATPVNIGSISVGLDPVSVRARSNTEVWVVNHVSDSVSIVDLTTMNVVATLQTDDEPCDIVFAGDTEMAFVSCSQANTVLVFDPNDLSADPTRIEIDAEDPRALAVSADGGTVYAAVFESGNKTTILPVHGTGHIVNNPLGPYEGQNPPPNDGENFNPPINPNLPEPPAMGLIVKKNADGKWMDDNGGDWTNVVSGPQSDQTHRPAGWDMPDYDVAIIDVATLTVEGYLTSMMNILMALDVHPTTGQVSVVGIESTNEIRFEPVLKARFVRVMLAMGDEGDPDNPTLQDLNPHLDYSDEQVEQQANTDTASQELRDLSIGDPRAILWNAAGDRAYIAGMGSNNVVVIDAAGDRVSDPIEVGEGPTGLAMHPNGTLLYVMNKFDGSISVIDIASLTETARVPFYDPTPAAIKEGRPFQYDTHRTSGLGQLACAGCHVDSRSDRMSWDLGNPAGEMVPFINHCGFDIQNVCTDYHPMKTAMMTQTLQDIIGKEPFHWRGDKKDITEFNGAFTGLQGDDVMLTDEEMQQYEDFLATIYFPPNPFRNFDNSLPTNLELPGHFSAGIFGDQGGLVKGDPMPPGNAEAGLDNYRFTVMHEGGPGTEVATCVLCHSLPTGNGAEVMLIDGDEACYPDCGHFEFIPVGPDGEHHTMVTGSMFGGLGVIHTFKVPQLRGTYDKHGLDVENTTSRAGFGFFHDGSDPLVRFISGFPAMTGDQDLSDMVAFLMSFSGSDLPVGSLDNLLEPPGPSSQDTHAAVGTQVTITETNKNDAAVIAILDDMMAEADLDRVGIVAKGRRAGVSRGYAYTGASELQSDVADETTTMNDLRTSTLAGDEITVTVVPFGTQTRIGIDRDEDGFYDGDELAGCSDPADPLSVPDQCDCEGDANGDGTVDPLDTGFVLSRFGCIVGAGDPDCDSADQNNDGVVNPLDTGFILSRFGDCP